MTTIENNLSECGIWNREGSCLIPLASLETLSVYQRKTISSDYLDIMGHMNIRWYFALFAKAGRKFFSSHGLNEEYFRGGESGVFTLKQFIQYFAEVRVGQSIAVRTRLIGRSEKRIHIIHFMVNESTSQLAATFEALITHADLKLRRAAPMPGHIADRFDATLAEDEKLEWEVPVCGAMRL